MTDRRKLSDEDVQAIIKAMIEHESHCKFKDINPADLTTIISFFKETKPAELAAATEFFKEINLAISDSKKTVRQTFIKLALAGIIALLAIGLGVKIKTMVSP